jgi:AcrR family transcriptional regulator
LQVAESRPVAVRRQAKQQRSRQKVQTILDTTLDMLGAMPSDRITTNEIAKTAGVNIATVYQYFPTKEAIFFEIYRRWLEQTLALLVAVDDRFDGTEGLDTYADAVFDCLSSEKSINAPGLWKLRFALGTTPELAELEAEHEARAFRRIIAAQEKFARKVTPDQARALARLQHHVSVSCLYAAAEAADPAERAVLFDWGRKTMRFVYDVENLKG